MLKQTNLAARFCKIRSNVKFSMCSQIIGNEVTVTDLYITELLGRVPTISIPIFNGIQKFQLASSSIQVFIQMILGHSDLILKNLVEGHIELPNATKCSSKLT